jgi:hypothetical protein
MKGNAMGTWDYGPFDNDTAADFAADLDVTPESARIDKLYDALAAAQGCVGRIDGARVEPAVAAAALAARGIAGGEEFQSKHYGPVNNLPPIPKELIAVAADVVERIIDGENDVKEYWNGTSDSAAWLAVMKRLRMVLVSDSLGAMDPLW